MLQTSSWTWVQCWTVLTVFFTCLTLQSSVPPAGMQDVVTFASKCAIPLCSAGFGCLSIRQCTRLRLRGGSDIEISVNAPTNQGTYSDLSGALSISEPSLSGVQGLSAEAGAEEDDPLITQAKMNHAKALRLHELTCKPPYETSSEVATSSEEKPGKDEDEKAPKSNINNQCWQSSFQKTIGLRGPVWGDKLPANHHVPPNAMQPWGSATNDDTWVGTLGSFPRSCSTFSMLRPVLKYFFPCYQAMDLRPSSGTWTVVSRSW